jgi:16S rRNA (guanine527-N7)-methyltransferase
MTRRISTQEARELLDQGLEALGVPATDSQITSLLTLAQVLEHWSERVNLTAHRSAEAIIRRLILDAAALVHELPEIATLVDIGSGAGFPGFPIAILRPGCRVTLVDSRQRRHHFQREAIRKLGLDNVHAVLGRAESLQAVPHGAAIAQAVAKPADALPLLLPWTESQGLLLFPGSVPAPPVPDDPRVCFETCIEYRVPCGGPERTLWIARRTSSA